MRDILEEKSLKWKIVAAQVNKNGGEFDEGSGATLESLPLALGEGVGVFPRLDVEAIRVGGRDRVKFLQGLLSNDVRLGVGAGCHAAFLTAKGKMQTELRIVQREEDLFMEVPAGHGAALIQKLDGFLFRAKVRLQDAGEMIATLVAGPRAREALEGLGLSLPEGHLGRAAGNIGGAEVEVLSTDWLGEAEAFHIWSGLEDYEVVLGALSKAAGSCAGGIISLADFERARLGAGVARFGVDIDEGTLPLEAHLDHLVSFKKGCYLGQEVIARVDSRGAVARHLVRLMIQANEAPALGTEIFRPPGEGSGRAMGALTTVGELRDGLVAALGWVRRGFETQGSLVEVGEGRLSAEVGAPLYSGR